MCRRYLVMFLLVHKFHPRWVEYSYLANAQPRGGVL